MSDSAIECKKLTKVFKTGFFPKPVKALKSISFEIPVGKVTGFLGPNGSGKSTFLKVATGFISPTEGSVSFFGGREFSDVKAEVGFVPEKPMYPKAFTGQQILTFHAKLTHESSDRVKTVILSSHLLEDLQRICNNLVVIESGELLFSGDPSSVFKPNQFIIRHKKGSQVLECRCSHSDLNSQLLDLIKQGVQFHSIEPESKAISSLYFELTKNKNLGVEK